MKKTLLLLATVAFSQSIFAKTTFNCKIQELASDKDSAPVIATHNIEVKPLQKINLALASSNLLVNIQGSNDDDVDLASVFTSDMNVKGVEGGLMSEEASRPTKITGKAVLASCVSLK